MPKRKRRDKEPTSRPAAAVAARADAPASTGSASTPAAIDPSVALFAQRHQEGIEREKAAQRARAAEKLKAGEHDRLVAAKDEAVATMKRIARASSSTAEQKAESEAAYRKATADLIAHETGDRPAWAPVEEDATGAADASGSAEPDADPGSDGDPESRGDGDGEPEASEGPERADAED